MCQNPAGGSDLSGGELKFRHLWGKEKNEETAEGSVADSGIIDDRDLSNSISPNGNAWRGRSALITAV